METTRRPRPLAPILGSGGPMGTAVVERDQFSRQLLSAMLSFRDGQFAVRLPSDLIGVDGKIADARRPSMCERPAPLCVCYENRSRRPDLNG
jgi:hypothetical protein